MASFAFTDAMVVIDSVDLSDHVTKVKLSVSADDLENTAMGQEYKSRIAGLKDWSVDVEFNQDFAADKVDDTMWPLLGTTPTISIRPTSGSVSATNPEYEGPILIKEYTPMDGSVGDLAKVSFSWPGAGDLTRSTS